MDCPCPIRQFTYVRISTTTFNLPIGNGAQTTMVQASTNGHVGLFTFNGPNYAGVPGLEGFMLRTQRAGFGGSTTPNSVSFQTMVSHNIRFNKPFQLISIDLVDYDSINASSGNHQTDASGGSNRVVREKAFGFWPPVTGTQRLSGNGGTSTIKPHADRFPLATPFPGAGFGANGWADGGTAGEYRSFGSTDAENIAIKRGMRQGISKGYFSTWGGGSNNNVRVLFGGALGNGVQLYQAIGVNGGLNAGIASLGVSLDSGGRYPAVGIYENGVITWRDTATNALLTATQIASLERIKT